MRDQGNLVPDDMGDFREKAILYVLRRMQRDVNLRHYLVGTETFFLLCMAEAERTLTPIDKVKKFYSTLLPDCMDEVAEVVKLRKTLDAINEAFDLPNAKVLDEVRRILEEQR